MENKIKLLIAGLTILLIGTIYWNFLSKDISEDKQKSVTKSSNSEKKELNFEEGKVSKKITNEETSTKKIETLTYKDVFKEPQQIQTEVEKIVERDELSDLNKEVESLILEADGLIEKEKLLLTKEEIPENIQAEYQINLDEIEEKLNKLETE